MNVAFFEENTMRKDDLLRMIDAIHRERGVELDILFEALEEALSMAALQHYPELKELMAKTEAA